MAARWWEALYDDDVGDVLLPREPAELDRTVRFLFDHLELSPPPPDGVFDQCAGRGTLSLALARRGVRVHGVEQAEAYVAAGRRDAEAEGLPVELVRGDARTHVLARPAAAGFNWATSFGYGDDAENLEMLRAAARSLRPGGAFALDFMNVPGVLRAFAPRVETHRAGVDVLRESEVDLGAQVMVKRWTIARGERRRTCESRVRLYWPDQLAALLGAAGFEGVRLFGSVEGEPLGLDSPRAIAVARRST